jgi:hypothetical protein
MNSLFDIVTQTGELNQKVFKVKAGYECIVSNFDETARQFVGVVKYKLSDNKEFLFNMVWDEFGNSVERAQKPWHHYLGLVYVK